MVLLDLDLLFVLHFLNSMAMAMKIAMATDMVMAGPSSEIASVSDAVKVIGSMVEELGEA